MRLKRLLNLLIAAIATVAAAAPLAKAHFPWIVLPTKGSNEFGVIFSENLSPDDPAMLSKIQDTKAILYGLDGQKVEVELSLRGDQLVGTVPQDLKLAAIEVPFTWGIFSRGENKFLLKYQAIGLVTPRRQPKIQFAASKSEFPALGMKFTSEGIQCKATLDGKPMPDEAISVIGPEKVKAATDSDGKWLWAPTNAGEYGVSLKAATNSKGEFDGEKYEEIRSYTTVTLKVGKKITDMLSAKANPPTFAELPYGITSFGAARLNDAIYVYGGHTGTAHAYSNAEQSNQLLMLDLKNPSKPWKMLIEGERLQGLALVADGHQVICIGGFEATNKEGEEQDLHSRNAVTAYDTKNKKWVSLPPLPEGRSSHDAILLDRTIYVVGGWNMNSPEETQWHSKALAMDLTADSPTWTEIAQPPFERRALALAAHNGKVYAIGGMTPDGETTRQVNIYDPKTNQWTDGPEIQGENNLAGFGATAWSTGGHLVVSNIKGDIQILDTDGQNWKIVGQTDDARFFHRILPLDDSHLISIGGANMESGKFLAPETISVK